MCADVFNSSFAPLDSLALIAVRRLSAAKSSTAGKLPEQEHAAPSQKAAGNCGDPTDHKSLADWACKCTMQGHFIG